MRIIMLNNKKILYTLLALSLTMNAFMAWICFSDKETDIAGRTYQTADSVENTGINGEYIVFENDGSSCFRYKQFDGEAAHSSLKTLGSGFYAAGEREQDGEDKTDYFYASGGEIYLLSGGEMTKYTKIADEPTFINTKKPSDK